MAGFLEAPSGPPQDSASPALPSAYSSTEIDPHSLGLSSSLFLLLKSDEASQSPAPVASFLEFSKSKDLCKQAEGGAGAPPPWAGVIQKDCNNLHNELKFYPHQACGAESATNDLNLFFPCLIVY